MGYVGSADGCPERGIVSVTSDTTYHNALMLSSMLLEYRLESVLGAGGFGLTYLGWDTHLEKHVAIKEYLPGDLAIRALDGSIVPVNTQSEYNYQWGLERFIQEARTLAKFSHPNIVRVNRFFEANGTSYMVMDYEAGESLYQFLRRAPMPDTAVLKSILLPILDGLEAIHQAGFLHRDIKPSNVFMRANGAPLLIDFGAARLVSRDNPERLTAIVSPGYAPLEQYSVEGDQGPWSDIYGLSGVMYRAVTDENPPDAVKRIKADGVPAGLAAARTRYDERFLKAIEWGLKTDEKLRPQNVAQWRELFSGRMPVSALNRAPVNAVAPPPRAIDVAAAAGAVAATVAQKTPAKPDNAQSGPRIAHITFDRWKWLWRGASFFIVAIALAAFARQHATQREPQKQPVAQVQTAAHLQRQATRRFEAADTDRSGDLTREEMTIRLPRFASRFDEIDADHDGVVTLRELERFLEKDGAADDAPRAPSHPEPVPATVSFTAGPHVVASPADAGAVEEIPPSLKKEFVAADRDADGYLSAWEVRGRFPAVERNFAEVDSNRDGRISLEEFWQFRRRLPAGRLPQS